MFDFDSIKKRMMSRGLDIKKEQLTRFDFNNFINIVTGGLVKYSGDINSLNLAYHQIEWSHHIFEYLLSKSNSTLLYKKIDKVEDTVNIKIFKKIKKLRWIDSKVVLNLMDYQNHLAEYTLRRIQYVNKKYSSLNEKKNKYEKYKQEIDSFSSYLFIKIGVNEQLQIESMPGAKYYHTDAISIFIKYKNQKIGLYRLKFLNKKTAYEDQGRLVSILHAFSYVIFLQEHGIFPKSDTNIDLPAGQSRVLEEIFKNFSEIEQIMIFREPKIGKVFEKYQYRYSPNYYFIHTLHTHEGIDTSRDDLVKKSVLVREQELAGKYLYNDQDTYDSNVCYFNFVEAILRMEEVCYSSIPKEIYIQVMDTVNEIFFDSVVDQQIRMVTMIDNRVKSGKFTSKIKSCNKTNIEIAEDKLKRLKELNSKKGPNRIKNDEYNQKSDCIRKWIKILKEKGRIDPGSNFFLKMDTGDKACNNYIIDSFSMMIPWMDWKDITLLAKEDLKYKLAQEKQVLDPERYKAHLKIYREYREDINIFLESLFGNKSFLYKQKKGGRAVFYESIEKQFDTYGKWEDLQREKKKEYSIHDILKTSVKTKMLKTLKSFLT